MKVISPDDALNLSDLLKNGDWMVLYYAEWCGHCNAMKPEWEKFITKMKDPNINSTNIKIADVKSDVIDKLEQKPDIPGFPTIKMYSNGKEVADFKDERVAEKMVEFAKSNTKANNTKPEPVAVAATAVEPIVDVVHSKTEELPMVAINTEVPPSIDLLSHKSQKNNSKKHKSTNKVSARKQTNKPLKMDNLLEMPKEETPVPATPVHAHIDIQQSFANIPCNEIRKAKHCKSNPKCMFDYPGNKCVFKGSLQPLPAKSPSIKPKSIKPKSIKPKSISHKSNAKNTKKMVKKTFKKTSKKIFKKANNNIKKSTKEVFSKLVDSFGRIGNEAKKDAKILQNATSKL